MRHILFGILAIGGAAALSFVGCGDPTETTAASTGGSGGAGGTGATGGTGGTGGGCSTDAECGTDTECRKFKCNAHACETTDLPAGTPATDATIKGDCQKTVCDGKGSTIAANDDADVSDDGTACTTDTCAVGVGSHTPTASGTACNDDGGAKCDGAGKCVECLTGPDCVMTGVCQQNKCVPGSCTNTMKDGGETDVDCGGPLCNKCGTNQVCVSDGDCVNSICTNGKCAAPTCSDGVKNGGETGKDCGGNGAPMSCNPCDPGEGCATPADCKSGVCVGNPLTCQAPSCSDGVENGGETDQDCGGPCVKTCGPGKGCIVNTDCTGGLCNAGTKTCDPTCSDVVKNNVETDVDCGGGTCAKCAIGKACNGASDCTSALCLGGLCAQVNGCDPATAADFTGQGSVTIKFGGALGFNYIPPCIKVTAGTTVTFTGSGSGPTQAKFSTHPLVAGEIQGGVELPAAAGTTPLPIDPGLSSGVSSPFVMSNAGAFGFYCGVHGSGGMNGAIFVQ